MPLAFAKTRTIGPLAAVRSRSRVVAYGSSEETFTFVLMQIVVSALGRFLWPNAICAFTAARALGAATPPDPLSIVSLVTDVQFEKSPLEKLSEKLPEAVATVIRSEAGLN